MNVALTSMPVTSPALRLSQLASCLRPYAYRYGDEIQLHGVLESVLQDAGEHGFLREHAIDSKNRFDFWFPDEGLVIEVKVDGSLSSALRQVDRYAHLDQVRGILLASTPRWGEIGVGTLQGKPLYSLRLKRQCL